MINVREEFQTLGPFSIYFFSLLAIFALLISNKNLTKSGRVIGWFGWWLSSFEAPRYIWHSVIKTTSSIVFTLLSLYPRMATIFSFYWVNTITFVVWKIDRSRDMNNTFLTKTVFLLKKNGLETHLSFYIGTFYMTNFLFDFACVRRTCHWWWLFGIEWL